MSVALEPTARDPRQAVSGTAGPAPVRPSVSIRRTSTVDMDWPRGLGTRLRLHGRARDAITLDAADPPIVVGHATLDVGIGEARTIEDIASNPHADGLQRLVGCRGGGHLRAALAEFLADEVRNGTPLHLLLDDISGTSLIAGFAWSQWLDPERYDELRSRRDMEGVCIGFRPGSSALVERQRPDRFYRVQVVGPLVHDADPHGWHQLTDRPGASMRRARRIDVWRDPASGSIMIDSSFQDSSTSRHHGRVAVHEYGLRASADPDDLTLTTVDPDARVLPFLTCPDAVGTAHTVVGTHLSELRTTVLERLAHTNGCTHLNDALRALAEVPILLGQLDVELYRGRAPT